MFKTIVVGLDGSEASEKALDVACGLSEPNAAEIHLVHTPQPQTVAFAMGAVAGYHAITTMPSADEVKEAAEKILSSGESITKKYNQITTQKHVGHGDPADQIVDYADECGADLVVTGRRGLGRVDSLLQGSTSQRVNHLVKCACLSVA